MAEETTKKRRTPRTIKAEDAEKRKAAVVATGEEKKHQVRRALDQFSNIAARLGFNTANLMEATEYLMTRITRNYQLMNTLYRDNWIVGKIIDTKPGDMVKNWYHITSEVPPEYTDKLSKLERKTRVRAKILEGLKWGDLYGGAGAVILIEGHEDILHEPLDLDTVMPGSFKGLLVVDRWSGITPSAELVTNINDPEFGYPASYEITPEAGTPFKVDHTRVIRFQGRYLPYWEKVAEMHWGASELERVFEELKKRDNTSWNIAQLVFLANLRILKMSDLGQDLAMGTEEQKQRLYSVLQAQNYLASNMGLQILDAGDDFVTHQYTFAGINDIYESFMMDVAGAAEIPITKLFGRSPAGLNSTGEGDLQNYYDMIAQRQEEKLRPVIDKLLPVLCMSAWGYVPDDIDFEFNPVKDVTDEEKADLTGKYVTAITDLVNTGIFGKKTALKEVKQLKDITGFGSNISDEMIEEATDDAPMGEVPGLELPGMPAAGGTTQDTSLTAQRYPPEDKTLAESIQDLQTATNYLLGYDSREDNGWIGVDLDGTLAEYNGFQGVGIIGKPINKMVERVKAWLKQGKRVKILTARAGNPLEIQPISKWLDNIGLNGLEITNKKSQDMIELWDDRAVRVKRNEGIEA